MEENYMIKRVKYFGSNALMGSEEFRTYVENFESEILRGISTLTILTIIREHDRSDEKGIYGYLLLQELTQRTKNMLIVEEGTLYPLLKKLEKDGIVNSQERTSEEGRTRKYYYMTPYGVEVFNHMSGFFIKLVESLGGLLEFNIDLVENKKNIIFCPNCANKIEISDNTPNFCIVCGYNIQDRIEKNNNGGN
jgi:DNA-binding PadR family transcriptional regulator